MGSYRGLVQVIANISARTGFNHPNQAFDGPKQGRGAPQNTMYPQNTGCPIKQAAEGGTQRGAVLFLHLRATRRKSSCSNPNSQHISIQLHSGDARRVTIMGTKNRSVLVMRGILMLQGIIGMCCSGSRLFAASCHQPDTEMQRRVATSGKHCLGRDDGFRGNDIIKSG